MFKKIIGIILSLAMVLGMVPFMASATEAPVLDESDYAQVDAVFDAIDAVEKACAKRSTTTAQTTDAAQQLVLASENYVEDSLDRNGDAFTWMTTEGIRCIYSPRMRKIQENVDPTAGEDLIYNEPVTTKGGWPSGNQVYLIGPYYGYDSDFTNQYKTEANRIAASIGDTDGYTLYSGKNATVDKVAEAVSKGAVVIFDSHGSTDYENGYDYVTGATSSYLCLTSTTGLTSADYADGALYYSDGIYINGATIANHMKSNSPGGILWMAICLGMATNTMCDPLREMGVEVVCGYSQSVTFGGDYLFEDAFWDKMCEGQTVAQANAYMKSTWGTWDWSTKIAKYYGYSDGYTTITAARADYAAFPVVVSDEDTHPGQRNRTVFYGADSLQTVKSTYTLQSQYAITATSSNTAYGTVSVSGSTITATPVTGYFAQGYTVLSGTATVTQNSNTFQVQADSDCTIQIQFAPKQTVKLYFSGANVAPQTVYAGDAMTLPTAAAPEGHTFLGWTTAPLSADTTEKPDYITGSFTPTGSCTLYALFSYVDETGGSGTGDYVKMTSAPDDWSGQYLIVYEGSKYIFDGSLTTFDKVSNYKAVTITGNTISAAQGDAYSFTIEPYGTGYSIQGTGGKYIGNSSNSNALTTNSSPMINRLSMSADGSVNIVSSGGSYLRFNNNSGQYRFRYYKSSSYTGQKAISLYLKDGSAGVTYYTSVNPDFCTHDLLNEGLCHSCGQVFAAQTANGLWATVQEAIENAPDGRVRLLRDSNESVTAQVLHLDLNGYLLKAVTVTQALYGIDTSATATTEGTGGILQVTGPVVQDHNSDNVRYIALEEDGVYTFHVLQLQLTAAVLRPSEAGLYYRASLTCDSTLASQIAFHGVALSTQDMPGVDYQESHNLYSRRAGAPAGEFSSVMVTGILKADASDNRQRGETVIYANAYLELTDGQILLADNTNSDTLDQVGFDGVAMSLRDVMVALNGAYASLTASQKATLLHFTALWQDPMKDWELNNLL